MSSRWARFARGWLAASFSVFVAAFAHVIGGGHVPSALAVVLSLAFAGIVAVPLAGKTVSLLRLSISVGVAQALFHTLFALGGGVTVTQLGHHGPLTITGATAVHGHEGMLPAHVLAAVVTIVALRLGEGAFWMLLGLAREGLRRTLLPASDPVRIAAPRTASFAAEPRPLALAVLRSPLSRRGPPALAV